MEKNSSFMKKEYAGASIGSCSDYKYIKKVLNNSLF